MKIFGEKNAKWKIVARPVLCGVAAGLAAVAFQNSIHWLYENGVARFARLSAPEFLLYSLLALAGTATAAALLVTRFCPDAAGSGSPQLKLAYWKDFGVVRWRTTWTKFLGSALTVGGGCSLGNEGPMVQIGGGAASNLAGALGVPAHMRREAAAAGAAAGLAAIFNAPMAAVAFVLEEVVENLNSRLIGAILIAAVTGALTAHFFMGDASVFTIPATVRANWAVYVFTPPIAALASLAGAAFQKLALGVRARGRTAFPRVPAAAKIVVGALCVWAIGSAVFLATGRLGVFSLGYGDLSAALNAELAWGVAALLLGAKLLATALCYGLGGCGGIFAPALFFGGTCGAALAGALALCVPAVGAEEVSALAVVGMCACFGSVVRAPVTGVLLVFEMTHHFSLVPALMLGGIVSVAVSKFFSKNGFYDEVLAQDGKEISRVIPPRDLRAWQDSPVSRIANFAPRALREDASSADAAALLAESGFARFPVADGAGRARGLVLREALEAALARCGDFSVGALPLRGVPACSRETRIREVERLLIEAADGLVVVEDGAGRLVGVVTLHDVLRAEMHFNET